CRCQLAAGARYRSACRLADHPDAPCPLRPRGSTMPAVKLPDPSARRRFQQRLLGWYAQHRRDLPWRRTTDPYRILVSEVMLQQTQVARVVPYYEAWLERFPSAAALADAPAAEVLRAWSGLGYNRRALGLQAATALVPHHSRP